MKELTKEDAKEKVFKWLIEEGFSVKKVNNSNMDFLFVAEDVHKRNINVYQEKSKLPKPQDFHSPLKVPYSPL